MSLIFEKIPEMELIHPLVQQYAEAFSTPEDELLQEISLFTVKKHPGHHMLSGHLQGKLLEMISRMIQPRRILEIGTFTGYSALCLAKGLISGGQLHTIELREADAAIAQGFFNKSSFSSQIILHTGNALKIIAELDLEVVLSSQLSESCVYWPRSFRQINGVFFLLELL